MNQTEKADLLRRLHGDEELLQVINVWDVIGATTIAKLPGTAALATASHSIAATFGYPDGEHIPRDLMLDMCGRIAAAVDLPVSADLEAGYGDAGETIRRAIGVGIVGANLEDQLKPFDEAVAAVRAAVAAAEQEGVNFALNARTDAFVKGADDPVKTAIERGKAFLDEGATCVFVPGKLDADTTRALVEGIGWRKVSVIGVPGALPPGEYEQLGVARISYGPWIQRAALTTLSDLAGTLLGGQAFPGNVRQLN